MLPIYKDTGFGLTIYQRINTHSAPHLHRSVEFVYVTEGELAIGVGQNLYPMEKGDFAVIFPDIIHHYQVFSSENSSACYILASPNLAAGFGQELQTLSPRQPVVKKKSLHPDVKYAVNALYKEFAKGNEKQNLSDLSKEQHAIAQSYIHILLARSIPQFELISKEEIGSPDLIYKTVSYISAHFSDNLTLTSMAHDLAVSQYTLSRVFSGTFHRNFNQYLNEVRLDYAQTMLRYSDKTITDICYEAGFESQRTFNRCFSQKYHLSPREYRKSTELKEA
jgi:AraC-like DNA-binding protein